MKKLFKNEIGITLIALVITIIVLLILAAVSIVMLTGENGILNKSSVAKEKNAENSSKEKLKLELSYLAIEKNTNPSYNKDEFVTDKLIEKGYSVIGDIVIVDEYQFKIDRDKLKIIMLLGKGKESSEIEINSIVESFSDFTKATIKLNIKYNGELKSIEINGEQVNIPEKTGDIYSIEKIVLKNGIYTINVKDINDEYKIENVKVLEIAENVNLKDVDDLAKVRNLVNKGATFEGKTITLSKDIDLSTVCSETLGTWTPIGNNTNSFKGIFDGNNKSISGLYMNSSESYQGFIGVNEGKIKNINISSDCIASSVGNRSGILCGENRGTIENCTSSGTFDYTISTEKYWQGAICGLNNGGIIINCANYGNITGYGNVGGITGGCGNSGIILNCLNTGDIKVAYTYDAGGICGNASQRIGKAYFFNCYNTGDISCVNYNVGGITGMSTNETYLYNCYNIGNISGIAYWESTKPNLNNCYCLDSISSNSYYDDKAPRVNETTLKKAIEILNDGIDGIGATQSTESPWIEDENNINRGFPILKFQV